MRPSRPLASFKRVLAALALFISSCAFALDCAPETWFHVIGGNASKAGIVADLDAIRAAGISGIQFFHGQGDGSLWPGVTNPIPCLSEQWIDLVRFISDECHKRHLTFKMQNCPGWSMSGGPWITPDKAMRKLVAFEPGKSPKWDTDDDYHEIGTVSFPWVPIMEDGGVSAVTIPNPQQINHDWAYEPDADLVVYEDDKEVFRRKCPQGAWQDEVGMTFNLPQRIRRIVYGKPTPKIRAEVQSRHYDTHALDVCWHSYAWYLDQWEAKAGWGLRRFEMSTNTTPIQSLWATKTLVFGHVNAKRKNHPAPPEGTGWECDKMDPRGFEANWEGYLGKLVKAGVKIDGTLVDSWECGVQNWTWKMEEEFEKRNGYKLRPWLPALFGYVLKSEAETEKFLLDWRNTCSRLIEENYYGTIARLAHENGMKVQYETAFGDVINGDILRYWKYADEPMCEFWSPFDNDNGFVGSHDFKPVLPCVSAAHIYGKRRVSAESLTSFNLTFDENFGDWKKIIDNHLGRGVTHIVFHTYTHNPIVDGKAPGSSFGGSIGSPFLRLQPWWKHMKDFTAYLENCCRELERGLPVVDILMYLGDDVNHKPSESKLRFDNCYKYDYLNNDVLMSRLSVKDGRLVLPDGMSYRVLWIPENTYVLPKTEERLEELAKQGARIVRGDFKPDWPSPLKTFTGRDGKGGVHWYQRHDGDEDIFFIAEPYGTSCFMYFRPGAVPKIVDAVTRKPIDMIVYGGAVSEIVPKPVSYRRYAQGATQRVYEYVFEAKSDYKHYTLHLGDVRNWATVTVNGQEASRLWCPPYKCDISDFVKPGENRLKIEVTSTIYNQLVLDAAKPENERKTWTISGPGKDAPLHEAGLLGPVVLRFFP